MSADGLCLCVCTYIYVSMWFENCTNRLIRPFSSRNQSLLVRFSVFTARAALVPTSSSWPGMAVRAPVALLYHRPPPTTAATTTTTTTFAHHYRYIIVVANSSGTTDCCYCCVWHRFSSPCPRLQSVRQWVSAVEVAGGEHIFHAYFIITGALIRRLECFH